MKLENITRSARWYDDACGTALAMELVGERWSLLIVRELMYGPRRFSELRSGLPGISANTLTLRLGTLERAGIVAKRMLPSPALVQVYELTTWGYQSETAIIALSRWAVSSPLHDPRLFMSGASLIMSMRTLFVPDRARDWSARIGLRLGQDHFIGEVGDQRFEVRRGEPGGADAVLEADIAWPILAVIYGHQSMALWEAQGLAVHGDRAVAERFAGLFELPPTIA